jgi:hypothetical protein
MGNDLCQPVNDWGLPDWRDEAAYGLISGWSKHRWRWEFSRRREDLRAYFDNWCEPSDKYVDANGKRPEKEGFCHLDARSEFGYWPLPNPRTGDHTRDLLWPHVGTGVCNEMVGSQDHGKIGGMLDAIGVTVTDEQEFVLHEFRGYRYARVKENQMALTFDLDKPLEAQLAQAKISLELYQKQRHGVAVQRRANPEKWLTYLRVLDAREFGASWAEISTILKYKAATPHAARDSWKQARELCFNFPY